MRVLVTLAIRVCLAALSPCRFSIYRLTLSAAPISPIPPSPPSSVPSVFLFFPPKSLAMFPSVNDGAPVTTVGEDSTVRTLLVPRELPPRCVLCAAGGDIFRDCCGWDPDSADFDRVLSKRTLLGHEAPGRSCMWEVEFAPTPTSPPYIGRQQQIKTGGELSLVPGG